MGALASRGVATQASTTDVVPVLAAVAAAVPVALRTRSMALPIVAGLAVFMPPPPCPEIGAHDRT